MITTTTLTTQKYPKSFEKAMATLNRKATRLNLPGIEFRMVGVRKVAQLQTVVFVDEGDCNEQETKVDVEVYDYEVTHLDIKQEGWTLLGRLSKDTEGGVFAEGFSPEFDRAEWSERNPCECDHCHTKRDRNFGWALRREVDGKNMLVGSSCAKLLLNGTTAAAFAFAAHIYTVINIQLLEEDCGSGTNKDAYCHVLPALAAVEFMVEEEGKWIDNERDDEGYIVVEGTHQRAASMIRQSGFAVFSGNVSDEHVSAAVHVIDVLLEIDTEDSFLSDLQYLVSKAAIPTRKLGLLCYARRAVQRHIAKVEAEALNATRNHFGEVKKRYDLELTGVRCHSFHNAYTGGSTYINTFEDSNCNVFVWKTSVLACEEGVKYLLKGTVKEHGEFGGTPQTVLTRCKWVNEPCLV